MNTTNFQQLKFEIHIFDMLGRGVDFDNKGGVSIV